MKYPIDVAIWVIGNLDDRSLDNVRNVMIWIAREFELDAVDSERLAMAFHLVKGRPYFYQPGEIKRSEAMLEEELDILREAVGGKL